MADATGAAARGWAAADEGARGAPRETARRMARGAAAAATVAAAVTGMEEDVAARR